MKLESVFLVSVSLCAMLGCRQQDDSGQSEAKGTDGGYRPVVRIINYNNVRFLIETSHKANMKEFDAASVKHSGYLPELGSRDFDCSAFPCYIRVNDRGTVRIDKPKSCLLIGTHTAIEGHSSFPPREKNLTVLHVDDKNRTCFDQIQNR